MIKFTNYCLLLTLALGFPNFMNSQDLKKNISKANLELLKELQEQEEERHVRVETFLANNPNVKPSLSEGEKIVHIYDIINGKPIYRATDNLDAARATQITHLQPGGSLNLNLQGTGMTIGVWDGGPVQSTHTEFSNSTETASRVTIIDNVDVDGGTGFSAHGTHVSGTIGARGVNPSAIGMATNVNIKSYNWNNDETEMVSAVNAAVDPIIISNHSYGTPIQPDSGPQLEAWIMGAYTQGARNIDNIARNNPQYLIVSSAGNSGNTSYTGGLYNGYDKLTIDKNAKNNLVIANASPQLVPFTYELQSVSINSSSSQGPTDDLRIKPDIAGDGTGLFSPVPTDSYDTYSGTSMSSPNVAGSLMLLQEYYNQLNGAYMNSSTLKALVCHTAVDDYSVPGPDPKFGWGFLDAKVSAETITKDSNSQSVIDELTLDNGQTYTFTFSAQAGEKLIATICWTDMPGAVVANGSLNDPTPRLINDLDLRLTTGTSTYLPWKLNYSSATGFSNSKADNSVDNVEKVEIDTPVSGVYTLTVTHKGTLAGNIGGPFDPQSQDFSLIVTGANLTLGVNDFELNDIAVWPNPASEKININLKNTEKNARVVLYDLRGRTVFETSGDNHNNIISIDVSNYSKGIYMLKVFNNSSMTFNKKIIVK